MKECGFQCRSHYDGDPDLESGPHMSGSPEAYHSDRSPTFTSDNPTNNARANSYDLQDQNELLLTMTEIRADSRL
jgi:hypothetical protein